MSRTILVTGGAGYIGSHTAISLLDSGYSVIIADDLSNSTREAVTTVSRLSGQEVAFAEIDLCNQASVDQLFDDFPIEAVIHFAGLKAVGESVEQPLRYYQNNLISTMTILDSMKSHGVFEFVFSSSATVYGDPETLPIPETAPTGATNPYGRTKLMIEEICRDLAASDDRWSITLLRYFNPVGAHPSGEIGEDPTGHPNNLVPFVMQVAVGRRPKVMVFGDDYDTPDGTGVRDYIHVIDLALGHVAALENPPEGCDAINLGTGNGASVLEIIEATEKVSGATLDREIAPRRAGDIAISLADPAKAGELLDWRADRGLDHMLTDAWRWQSRHPEGFSQAPD